MLLEKVENALLLGVFDRLFSAETEEAVNSGFDELNQVGEAFAARVAKAEADERKELNISRVESADVMQQVKDEWGWVEPEAEQAPE